MKINCGSSPDSITQLLTRSKKILKMDQLTNPEIENDTSIIYTVDYYQTIPNSQYFTELEQILACLQLNWDNQEYMITALKNSIKMGYKLVNNQ